MKIGLEAEYWVVDDTGALCDGRALTESHERATPEFVPSMIEVQTPPVETVAALGEELQEVLETVLRAADADGKRLVPLGTPLTAQPFPIATRRGALLERIYGPGIACAKNCAGTHIHFEHGRVARQLNLLTALDPALALVSSSPYYCGERLANCSRAAAYRKRMGAAFDRYRDLWEYAESAAEWDGRLDARYDELRAIAAERGVSSETFERWFEPENAVMTPVRLRTEAPTVEWRAPDTALPSEILRLAAAMVPLVRRTATDPVAIGDPGIESDEIAIPPFADLEGLVEEAIDSGLGSWRVREYLETMGFEPDRYEPITGRIDAADPIAEDEAAAIRLECARELCEDIETL